MVEGNETKNAQGISKEAGKDTSGETLKPTYEEVTAEKDRKEAEINRLHGVIKANQRQSITRNDFTSLTQQVNDNLEFSAKMFDNLKDLVVRQLGTDGEPLNPSQQGKTFTEQLQERTKAAQEKDKPDPDTQAFATYMSSQGLNWDSQEVQDSIYDENGQARTGKDALTQLRTSVETKKQTETKAATEQDVNLAVEKKLKDMGLAGAGAISPSGSAGNLDSLSADQKLQQGFAKLADKK